MDVLSITYFLNGFLMIAMPIALAVYLTRRWKLDWRIWWIGAVGFTFSQAGHIPFLWAAGQLLNRTNMVSWSPAAQMIFNAVFLGLSAGIFEEAARYFVLRWWAKDARSWRMGVLFGAGHGGAEAIILGVLVMLAYIQLAAFRNVDLASIVPANQLALAQQQIAEYWSTPWYMTMLGALERLFTIPLHIACAVLVLQAFTRKNFWWVGLAIFYHALADGVTVLASGMGFSALATEGIIGVFAVVSVFLIFSLRQPEPPADLEPAPSAHNPFTPKVIEETTENLDKTKYQ